MLEIHLAWVVSLLNLALGVHSGGAGSDVLVAMRRSRNKENIEDEGLEELEGGG